MNCNHEFRLMNEKETPKEISFYCTKCLMLVKVPRKFHVPAPQQPQAQPQPQPMPQQQPPYNAPMQQPQQPQQNMSQQLVKTLFG